MTTKASAIHRTAMLAIAAGLLATACSNTVTGNPAPSNTASSGSASTSTATSNVFDTMDACQVLDQLLTGQGFNPGEKVSARNECHASKLDFGTYSIALDPVQGLAEFTSTNPSSVKTSINDRTAMQAQPGEGMCEFVLEVSQHARALAGVTMARAKDSAQACPNARQFAEKLEPLLPKAQ